MGMMIKVEYELQPEDFCPQANAMNFDFLKKHFQLDAWRVACRDGWGEADLLDYAFITQ
jgi:hypothetical protein